MTTREAYELLGLKPPVDAEAVRSAYRRKALETHPDRFPESQRIFQERRFMEVREAYARLRADGFPDLGEELPDLVFPAQPAGRRFASRPPEPGPLAEKIGWSWPAEPGTWVLWGVGVPAAAGLLAYLARRWIELLRDGNG